MSDDDRKDLPPADPWARWRKPEAAPAVDAGKTRKTAEADQAQSAEKTEPAAKVGTAVDVVAAPEAPAADKPTGEPGRTTGTLSPRKVLKPVKADKPRARSGGQPAERRENRNDGRRENRHGSRDERPAGKVWGKKLGEKPGEKPGERPEGKAWGRAAGEGRPAGKPYPGKDEGRSENPWGKPRSAAASPARPAAPRRDEAPQRAEAPVKIAPAPVSTAAAAGEAPSGVRLSKVMSERGLCSRREADLWIERGWVFVDGEQISALGTRIDPTAEVTVSKEAVKDQAKAVTILLHKPVGYVSGQPEPGCVPAVTLITPDTQVAQGGDPEFKPWMLRGLAPAGRLDVDSTGLLVLTSDGRVAKKLIGEDSQAEKEYLVRVAGQMIPGGLDLLRHGLELDGKPLKPAWVKQLNEDQLHFILKEGKKRQIRRMCELVGLTVIGLKRVRIGRVRLGDLPLGQWRFLRADEAF